LAEVLELDTDDFWAWFRQAQVVQTEINKQVVGT
jgi:hypothetical protein